MPRACRAQCIVPPQILRKLLQSDRADLREIAMRTLLATTRLRAERHLVQFSGFTASIAGTKARTIFDCGHATRLSTARLARDEHGKASADRPVNEAFDGLGQTSDFLMQVLGRNSIDDRGMRLDGYVHYGERYNNAFWNGRQMIFGDGDGVIFNGFTGAIDVIAHELGHGVTEFCAGLEYHDQPGALNESMSDVFGSMVKQWTLRQDAASADWLIGNGLFTKAVHGKALRSMKAPGTAYDDKELGRDPQPAHMRGYQGLPDTEEGDWGGVHVNSGIPNHAFYLAASAIGGPSWSVAGAIWYEALRQSEPKTDFAAFAQKTLAVALQRHGARSAAAHAVENAWLQVGVPVKTFAARPPAPTKTRKRATA